MNIFSPFDGCACARAAVDKLGIPCTYYASEVDKWAIQIANKNYPDIIQLGDIQNIKGSDLPEIDLMIGGSPCFVAGTYVLTVEGYKPIEKISVGDLVLSHTGNWRKVNRIGSKINVPTRILRGFGNCGIETTDEHPFYVREMYKKWDNSQRCYSRLFKSPTWKTAVNITKYDYVGITAHTPPENQENYIFWYIIGRYTGDGWYLKTKRKHRKNSYLYKFIICCGHHEFDNLREKLNLFGVHYNFTKTRTVYKFYICSQELVSFVEPIGKGASNKILHPKLFHESLENIKAFLDGLWDSDGCVIGTKFKLSTTSKKLALGVQYLVQLVYNSPAKLYKIKTKPTCIIENRVCQQKDWYQVVYDPNVHTQDKAFYENNYCWIPGVKTNIPTGTLQTVYNLEVDIDNSYTVNNIVVHNCQDLSIAGNGAGLKGSRSALFYDFVRLLEEIKPKYFVLENVASMKKVWRDKITEILGVEPILIDSALVSAQQRKRLYWTNIQGVEQPEDKGILFGDIRQHKVNNFYYTNRGLEWIKRHSQRTGKSLRIWRDTDKAQMLEATMYKKYSAQRFFAIKDILGLRYVTPVECERLQTLPDNYTEGVSNTQRYRMLGNGFTVDVIAHILSYME